MTRNRLFWTVVVTLAAAGCRDQGPISAPGTMTVSVVSPNGAEGAAIVSIVEGGLGTPVGLGGAEAFAYESGGSTTVIVVNRAGGDLAFQIQVADTTVPPGWSIHEVAGPDDALRSLVGYSLELRP